MAYVAGVFNPAPAMNLSIESPFIASSYPLAALYLLWGATALYVLLGVVLLVLAGSQQGDEVRVQGRANKMETTSTLALAHRRLVDPTAIVAEHFVLSGDHSKGNARGELDEADLELLSVQDDAVEMFAEVRGRAQGRLRVGFDGGHAGGTAEQAGLRRRIFRVAYGSGAQVVNPFSDEGGFAVKQDIDELKAD